MLNHEPLRLADGEYRFACLVWDNEPLPSGQLVALAAEGLGWKKSTTYTVLKKLCERGVLQNATLARLLPETTAIGNRW